MASKNLIRAWRRSPQLHRKPHEGRMFTSSASYALNPLLNLSHFSASKEAQYFSKERRIPREEFHPNIQLIRASEVDPFAPVAGASPSVVAALKRAETGKTDMETTYTLAITNLIQQVELARRDAVQTQALLTRIHQKYKREERNSFIIMLTAVGLFSLILVKTDALQDLKDYAREIGSQWKGFDWEWLGNPPSYRNTAHSSSIPAPKTHMSSTPIPTPSRTSLSPVEAQHDQLVETAGATQSPSASGHSTHRWTPSRLFWATPVESQT